jgi:hypothetical protein
LHCRVGALIKEKHARAEHLNLEQPRAEHPNLEAHQRRHHGGEPSAVQPCFEAACRGRVCYRQETRRRVDKRHVGALDVIRLERLAVVDNGVDGASPLRARARAVLQVDEDALVPRLAPPARVPGGDGEHEVDPGAVDLAGGVGDGEGNVGGAEGEGDHGDDDGRGEGSAESCEDEVVGVASFGIDLIRFSHRRKLAKAGLVRRFALYL